MPSGRNREFLAACMPSSRPMPEREPKVEYDNGDTPDNTVSGSLFRVTPALRMNFGSCWTP